MAKYSSGRIYHVPILSRALEIIELLQIKNRSISVEDLYRQTRFNHLLVLVGGTSQLPIVRDRIAGLCPTARIVRLRELDEMFATVRGVGFDKDFRDLIVLRPPYGSEVRVTERDGGTRTIRINEAFDGFDKQQFFLTSVPSMSSEFEEFAAVRLHCLTLLDCAGRWRGELPARWVGRYVMKSRFLAAGPRDSSVEPLRPARFYKI